ncbi:MaoC/PaaZ C-terminal domain-containing protein [Nevskia sp.]|uniref:MaoC/PaaZ C-terminal domain-containing protein n=1 Tax=Nevskia sp. TaxID=1929292 RepID=UPI0025CC9969|nr:MaoC/PaaZ C-terminal domain-containing protein [Nevskia sp.]
MNLDTANPGDLVAEYQTGPIPREQLALYAVASGDSNPLHLETAFAQKAGFDEVIVHGMLGMALLGRLVSTQFAAFTLTKFDARFVAVLPVNHSLRCTAKLASRTGDSLTLDLEAFDGNGKSIIVGSAALTNPA